MGELPRGQQGPRRRPRETKGGGGGQSWEWWQTQERSEGHIDKRQRLADGGFCQRPGGRCFAPGEDVSSGCILDRYSKMNSYG